MANLTAKLPAAKQLSASQQIAYQALISQQDNFLLTGRAGSGKTYLLQQAIRDMRKMGKYVRVAAFTGLAAQALGGTTLSKLLGLKLAKTPDDLGMVNFRQTEKNLEGTDVVVIDEISMVSGDTLELIDLVMREATGKDRPFGGIRIVFCGDFLQLPPIRGYGQKPFQMGWAFEYGPFQESIVLSLEENHRQTNAGDLQLLNEFREGIISPAGQKFLAAAVNKPLQNPVYLYPKREEVDQINQRYLDDMPGPTYTYPTTCYPTLDFKEIKGFLPIGEKAVLKREAPVIIVSNDPDGYYVNGSQGYVMELYKNGVQVELRNGQSVRVPFRNWTLNDPQGQGSIQVRGVPLQLGWAATIHRAQGMTLDAVETDLHRCWEAGQAYVALSRTRSLQDISLRSLPTKIKVDPVALAYVNNLS